MKRLAIICLLLALLALTGLPAYASVTLNAVINQSVHVVFNFENINSTIWEKIVYLYNHDLLNETTFPRIVLDYLKQRNLNSAYVRDSEFELNYAARSMHAAFYLFGSDILSFTVDKITMTKIYRVRTEWRKFYANFTGEQGLFLFSLNFAKYFGASMSQWREVNYTLNGETRLAYYYNYTGPSSFDPLCYFILPATVTNPEVVGDMIIFEFPPAFEDVLLNSPFLVVAALIIVNVFHFVYRKVRKVRREAREV